MSAPSRLEGVRVEVQEGGAIWRVVLDTPKANILDAEKMASLTRTFEEARGEAGLKALLIEGEGEHFSFGASVPEHLPGKFEEMIPAFHRMFRALWDTSVVTVAAVRGQCLGGGLELAAFCHRVVASPIAKLGQPEIVLGVLAPVASVILPERMGRPAAEELLLTGRILPAAEALERHLVDEIAEDPAEAALAWIRKHLLPRSASSLRHAVAAARVGWRARFLEALDEAEHVYVHDLMSTADAAEGLRAFLEKREPVWRDA
ncbi:MAG: enoyl-CoA hydratase-related protein [bacterium]